MARHYPAKIILLSVTAIVLLVLLAPAAATRGPSLSAAVHHPVVQELVDLVTASPAFRAELEAALAEQEPTSYWYGKTLDEMYVFLDEWVVFLPTIDNARLYMDRFYEFADAGKGREVVSREPFRSWLYRFMQAVGQFMDSPASAVAVPWWTGDPRINMDDYVVPPGGYQSFNQFFVRSLKPGKRPIASPEDPSILTSPADSTLMKIDDSLTAASTIGVKGENLNISELLGNDARAADFIGGKAVLCMLNTTNYHRYHAPAPGHILAARQIGGLYYGMDGGWIEYFFQHRRGYFLFNTQKFGHVAMVCVGMFTISSVNFIRNAGEFVNKGDELGNFQYGGSAVILLFEPGRIEFTVPLGRPAPVVMGQQLGRAVALPPAPVPENTGGLLSTGTRPSGSAAMPVTSPPVQLPNIVVQGASLSAARVAPGDAVNVTASIYNKGTVNGSTRVTLYVNGAEESTQGVTVGSGATAPVSFTVRRGEPGVYSVYVGNLHAGSFEVKPDADAAVILAASSVLLLAALVMAFVYVKRR